MRMVTVLAETMMRQCLNSTLVSLQTTLGKKKAASIFEQYRKRFLRDSLRPRCELHRVRHSTAQSRARE